MVNFLQRLPPVGQLQQTPNLPELPPGPSLDRVRGPVEIPFLETWQIVLIVSLGIVIVSILTWKFFQSVRKRGDHRAQVAPVDAAITALKSATTLATEDDERFAVLTSLALRCYFETSKGINALGKTTDEFLNSLNDGTLLDADARKSLAEFLQQCDRVKFAQLPLAQDERNKLTQSALELIERCETIYAETNASETPS